MGFKTSEIFGKLIGSILFIFGASKFIEYQFRSLALKTWSGGSIIWIILMIIGLVLLVIKYSEIKIKEEK